MKITFWGAAQTTTGSFHLVEHDGHKVALDCGLFQGRRADFYTRNIEFPCRPEDVKALILSHAHIDHCGNIPNFVKQGFDRGIHCTHATLDLARALLLDSAFIQEKEVRFLAKHRDRNREQPREEPRKPLYTIDDAERSLPLFVGIGYYRWFSFAPGFSGKFLEAGHILGSAQVELDVEIGPDRNHRIAFSGDIGRGHSAILRPPEIPSEVDTLIMESTYGNRDSSPLAGLKDDLLAIVRRVSARGGKVIIPAFSVGRTQDIVYQLNLLFNEGAIPRIPIYVDSPLSTNVTRIFKEHPECYNRETRDRLMSDSDPFGFETLTYTRDVEESKALNDTTDPCVIISASGMCENGRILHHLRNSVGEARNCVLIVGYQAEHTLGRRLRERQPVVRIFGEEHAVRCEVAVLDGFSAHADRSELQEYAFRVHARSGGHLRRIFLVHGEPEPSAELAAYLRESLKIDVFTPNRGETFEL